MTIAPPRPPVSAPRPILWALAAIALALLFPAAASAADHDLWYVIEMDGQRAGTVHSVQSTGEGHITTLSATRLQIRRGQTAIEVSINTEFIETLGGSPVSMKATQSFGAAPTTTQYTFGPESVAVVTLQGDGTPTSATVPLPEGVWLTPAAAMTFTQKRLEAGAAEIIVRIVDPSIGLQPIVSTRRVLERTTAEALGKIVPAIKCAVANSAMPGIDSIEFIDERGVPIRSSSNLGGIAMTIVAADRELATAELDPPEIMERTFVKPNKPIAKPRDARLGSYVLSVPDAPAALDSIPDTSVQFVETIVPGEVRITVNLDAPAPAGEGDAEDPAYLAPSRMLNTGDATIKGLVERATARLPDAPVVRAEAMRKFVGTHINIKNLGVGFASASEVARTREGDCTEHATLLAAMLRADGIPSRAVSGLVYADAFGGAEGIFGYHMWTQALLEVNGRPTWVDLDATLGAAAPFDATHIALAVTALGDDEAHNALVTLAPLLGRLAVDVEAAK